MRDVTRIRSTLTGPTFSRFHGAAAVRIQICVPNFDSLDAGATVSLWRSAGSPYPAPQQHFLSHQMPHSHFCDAPSSLVQSLVRLNFDDGKLRGRVTGSVARERVPINDAQFLPICRGSRCCFYLSNLFYFSSKSFIFKPTSFAA